MNTVNNPRIWDSPKVYRGQKGNSLSFCQLGPKHSRKDAGGGDGRGKEGGNEEAGGKA
jgi:hypothetical protein